MFNKNINYNFISALFTLNLIKRVGQIYKLKKAKITAMLYIFHNLYLRANNNACTNERSSL